MHRSLFSITYLKLHRRQWLVDLVLRTTGARRGFAARGAPGRG